MLLALDLRVISKTQDLSTDQRNKITQMKSSYLQSTQSSERDKLIEDLQQSILYKGNWYHYNICTSHYMVFLLALDLAVISKTQNLLTDEGNEKTQTKTREEESTLSNNKNIGILRDDIDLVITCVYQNRKIS